MNSTTARRAHSSPAGVNGKARLLPQHLDDLRRSGLADETISRCGFYSERDAGRVRTLLNWDGRYDGTLGACLVIPYFGPDGRPDVGGPPPARLVGRPAEGQAPKADHLEPAEGHVPHLVGGVEPLQDEADVHARRPPGPKLHSVADSSSG